MTLKQCKISLFLNPNSGGMENTERKKVKSHAVMKSRGDIYRCISCYSIITQVHGR